MSGTFGSARPDANPELANSFILELDRIKVAAFEKCKIGDKEWSLGQTRTGLDGLEQQTYSGLQKPVSIRFEKTLRVGGISDLKQLVDWYNGGSKDRRGGSVTLLDRDAKDVFTIVFENGWVSKCEVPEMDARSENPEATFVFEVSVSKWNFA
jgi:hypothetical protein